MRTSEPDDPLADRLRSAADAMTPPFSEDLHAAVMRQLRAGGAIADPPGPRRPMVVTWITAGVAAAIVAAVGIRLMRPAVVLPRPGLIKPVEATLPGLPSLSGTVDAVSRPIARQLADARLDLVDRSAGRLARYCVGQLDVFPAVSPRPAPSTGPAEDAGRS
jgi:hypothetical protein